MKIMKKICCVAMIAAVAVGFTACGSGGGNSSSTSEKTEKKPKTAKTQKLEIQDSGYQVKSSDGEDMVYYAVKVYNPNQNKSVGLPTIAITGYDADGKVTGTDDQTLNTIYPKQTAYFGFVSSVASGTKKVKFSISANSDEYKTMDSKTAKEKSNQFKLSGVHSNNSTFPTVTGTVKNTGKDCDQVMISTVFLNKGKIVYGDSTFVDNLAKGQEKAFEVFVSSGTIPDHDKIITFAQDWSF